MGAVLATFTNTGPSTLNHVVVTVNLPAGVGFDSADSSTGCTVSGSVVTCSLVGGTSILVGTTVYTTIAYTAPSTGANLPFTSSATANSQTKGKPNGNPGNQNFKIPGGGATPNLLSAGSLAASGSSCKKTGDTFNFTLGNGQGIGVTAGGNSANLTCTPITTGIDNSAIGFVKLPLLQTPGTVTLSFSDGNLPFSTDTDADTSSPPAYLYEFPQYPNTNAGTEVSVPGCSNYVQNPGTPAVIPTDPNLNGGATSSDSCIQSVSPGNEGVDGEFPDNDAGTITLEVTGSNTGDGGYPGLK